MSTNYTLHYYLHDRNQALAERKLLKEENKIISGYVAYPATLMVKSQGEPNIQNIDPSNFAWYVF